jgi:aminobenzoyl-glutamate utilization protein B
MRRAALKIALMGAASLTLILSGSPASAQVTPQDKQTLIASVEKGAPRMADVAHLIWEFAEVGYQETKSSALLQSELRKTGFSVQAGVAGMPTAFVASFKNGEGPVIAILAEYDALPGLAQEAKPEPAPIAGQIAGHACGHHLFGAASVAAAQSLAAWMKANNVAGEIRVYGTPAEEGGSGKVYMVREGLFSDVDATLHWHPSDGNSAAQSVSLANISGKFRFAGASAHASAAPFRGRSALDGVEIMNVAVNYLREHIPDGTRIHYVVTDGGAAPNVVPDKAEVYYYVRHTDPQIVRDVFARMQKAAEGAALATETTVSFEQTGGVYNMLVNDTLGQVMDQALREVGPPVWNDEEKAFAEAMSQQLPAGRKPTPASEIRPYSIGGGGGGSTDVADVSWVTPTAGMGAATWVPGTAAHSWQAVAAGGTSIGSKGAEVAAKTLALAGARLLREPALIETATAELLERRGADFTYEAMVGDRAPPLDYRKSSKGD